MGSVAAELGEAHGLSPGLDALGHDAQAVPVGLRDDRRDDPSAVLGRDVVHVLLAELDHVDRKGLDRAERGVPAAEVVDGDRHTGVAQAAQQGRGTVTEVDDAGLGELETERAVAQAALVDEGADQLHEAGGHQLGAADVEPQPSGRSGQLAPDQSFGDPLVEDPGADPAHLAAGLREFEEVGRLEQPPRRVAPAQQALHRDDRPGRQVDLRLVEQLERAVSCALAERA